MNEQKKINQLITWLSIAFVVICAGAYFLTNDKVEWYWKFVNNLIPELLGPVIALLFVFYAFTLRGISLFHLNSDDRSPQYTIAISDLPVQFFGVEITSHTHGSKVERLTQFSGTYKSIPKNTKLRIYVANENLSLCWVNTQNVIADPQKNTWESAVYVGGENSAGKTFYVIVAIEDEATEQWVDYYKQMASKLQDWKALKYPLPKSIVEAMRLKVSRI